MVLYLYLLPLILRPHSILPFLVLFSPSCFLPLPSPSILYTHPLPSSLTLYPSLSTLTDPLPSTLTLYRSTPSVRAVVDLIRQGRCTLLSSLMQQQVLHFRYASSHLILYSSLTHTSLMQQQVLPHNTPSNTPTFTSSHTPSSNTSFVPSLTPPSHTLYRRS